MKQVEVQYKSSVQIYGKCHDDFQEVVELFVQNFDIYSEVGSSLCVVVDGEIIVDIWGGHTTEQRTEQWNEETLSVAFSSTKAALALCIHLLIDREEIHTEDKVVKYWPEYGKNGKEETTVGMILNHTAGLPALKTPVQEDGFYDWEYMTDLLENEEPFWNPGGETGYHMMTTGWLIGELIRRISG